MVCLFWTECYLIDFKNKGSYLNHVASKRGRGVENFSKLPMYIRLSSKSGYVGGGESKTYQKMAKNLKIL